MKKLLLCSLIGLASPSYADFIGIYGKVGIWNADFEGTVAGIAEKNKRGLSGQPIPSFQERGFNDSQREFDANLNNFEAKHIFQDNYYDTTSNYYSDCCSPESNKHLTAWLAFEHPIPFLPNIRIGYTNISGGGLNKDLISADRIDLSTIGFPIEPGKSYYNSLTPLGTHMEFDVIDGTFYWEVLDNWVNLDLGLTFRKMDGEFTEYTLETPFPIRQFGGADGCGGLVAVDVFVVNGSRPGCLRPPAQPVTPIDLLLPMVYAKAQIDLPFTGVYLGATLQAISYSGNGMTDIDLELGYNFDFTVLDAGVSVGYRTASLQADDLEGLYAKDAKISGGYAALNLHF